MMRPLKLLSLLIVPALLATGCTRTYWDTFLKTSGIQGAVVTKGNISWVSEFDEGGRPVFKLTKTAPILTVSLIPGSAAVDVMSLQAKYYSPLADEDGKQIELDVAPIHMPFLARLQPDTPTSITLGQIISDALVNDTNPQNTSRLTELDIEAKVRLSGRDQVGNSTTWDVTVPISIEVE